MATLRLIRIEGKRRAASVWLLLGAATLPLFFAVCVAILLAMGGVNVYRVSAASMEPTFHCARGPGCLASRADSLIATSAPLWFRSLRRRDIVIVRNEWPASRGRPAGELVKRIVGLPGERISEKRGRIFIDGRPLAESYVTPLRRDTSSFAARSVPRGNYFVMGDNRRYSYDSRTFGPVPRAAIVGVVIARVGGSRGPSLLAEMP